MVIALLVIMIHPSSRVARPSRDHDLDPCAVLTCTLSDHVVVGGGGGIGGQGTAIGGAGRSIGAIGAPQLMVATLESRARAVLNRRAESRT